MRLHQRRGHRHPVIRRLCRQPILHVLRRQQIAHRNRLFLKRKRTGTNAPAPRSSTPYTLFPTPCLLAIHQHLVVRIVRALHHNAAELHHNILRSQRTRNTKLEDPRIRIAQPVILNQVLGHDVSRQHSRTRTRSSGIAQRPLRNQRNIARLRRQRLHREARRNLLASSAPR